MNESIPIQPPMAYDEKDQYGVIVPRVIKGFPYSVKHCVFCEREMEVLNAVHLQEHPELYKALMICLNPDCGAYDEEAKSAYVKVVYSSEEALQIFETTMLRIQRLEKT